MRYLVGFVCVLAVLSFAACGSGDGDCAEPAGDASGVWQMNATPIEDTCDGDLTPYALWVTILQEGNALTGQTPEGTLTGTICGDRVQMSDTYSVQGGGTSTVNLELTVLADGNSVEGSATWSWTYGGESCGGSESLSGVRVEEEHSAVCEPACARVSECSIEWNCGQSCYFSLDESARDNAECERAFVDLYACLAGLSCDEIEDFLTGGDPCEANDLIFSVCNW